MDSNNNEIIHDFPPFFKVFKDGSIERYMRLHGHVPVGLDPTTGVQYKDVVVSPETGVKARVFIPKIDGGGQKLPLLVHYHGGLVEASAWDQPLMKLIAPEHPLPIAYDDSSAALHWIASHSNGEGPEAWLNEYADLDRVFLGGESAGAEPTSLIMLRSKLGLMFQWG
ncbi:hypothetical protein ABKV19_000562 [Rosa sericea]